MGIKDFFKMKDAELNKAEKQFHNKGLELAITSMGKKYTEICCAYDDCKIVFDVKTTIEQVENHKETLIENLNVIAALIKDGHTLKDEIFNNCRDVKGANQIELLPISN